MKYKTLIFTLTVTTQISFCQSNPTAPFNNDQYFQTSNDKDMYDEPGYDLSFHTGAGTFMMSDLKKLQSMSLENGLPLVTNSYFPPYLNYTLRVGEAMGNGQILGISGELTSTGARMSLEDYSGRYLSETKCLGISIGVYYSKTLSTLKVKKKQIDFGYQLDLGALISEVKLSDEFKLYDYDYNQSEDYTFTSGGGFFTPSMFTKIHLTDKFAFVIDGGYAININSTLSLQDEKDAKLIINGKSYKADWSGFRIKIGTIWRFETGY